MNRASKEHHLETRAARRRAADDTRATRVRVARWMPEDAIHRAQLDPGSLAAADVMGLQHVLGNRMVRELVHGARPAPNLTGMPDPLKAGVEALSGHDLSDIRVHANSDRPAQVGAHAYTQGNEIHIAPGQQGHLAHEAWHVVQQRQGRVAPTMQVNGTTINNDAALEREADVMGARALATGWAAPGGESQGIFHTPAVAPRRQLHGSPVIQRMPYDQLLEIKTTNEHAFIRTVLGSNFGVSVWKFPKQSRGDGIMGKNCISAAHKVTVTGATDKVALHINFMITAKGFTKGATKDDPSNLTFALAKLHITARSAKTQLDIEEDGPSILTAEKSIHCGPNNDWDWTNDNVGNLTTDIGATLVNLQAAINPFGMTYVAALRDSLRTEITRAARNREVAVAFENDRSWA